VNEVTAFTTPAELGSTGFRAMTRDGNPWFALPDLCRALEHSNPTRVASRLDADEKITLTIGSGNRGNPNVTFVSEAGLYFLIMTSRTPKAQAFKRWVTHEVLPAIRKDGGYIMGEEKVRTGELAEAEFILQAMTMLQGKVTRLTTERDQLAVENAVMEKELTEVTVDEWRALRHLYLDHRTKVRVAQFASRRAKRACVPLGKQVRLLSPDAFGFRRPVTLNVYPADLLDGVAAELGIAGNA
jgi:prophage antirepressor-like protein